MPSQGGTDWSSRVDATNCHRPEPQTAMGTRAPIRNAGDGPSRIAGLLFGVLPSKVGVCLVETSYEYLISRRELLTPDLTAAH